MSSLKNLTLSDPSIINESNIFDNDFNILNNKSHHSSTKNLSELLLSNINIPSYQLTTEQIDWINQYIKLSPVSFEKISFDLQSISSSGLIELNKIPQIVKLFADIYYSGAINYSLINTSHIITFIKFTLDVLFDYQVLISPGIEKEVLKELIDISITLLSMNISYIEDNKKKLDTGNCLLALIKLFKLK